MFCPDVGVRGNEKSVRGHGGGKVLDLIKIQKAPAGAFWSRGLKPDMASCRLGHRLGCPGY